MKSGTTIHSRHCWVSRSCKDRRQDHSKGRRNPNLFPASKTLLKRALRQDAEQSATLRLRLLGCGTTVSPLRSAWAARTPQASDQTAC
jgi:hypothetical protein